MQTIWHKFNRGILLSVIILLGVIIYLSALAAVQSREKPLIEAICREYTAVEVQYRQLPLEYRAMDTDMPEAEQAAYLAAMRADILPFYIENTMIRSLADDRITADLTDQIAGYSRIQTFEKTIVSFDSYVFDGSRVTVTFTSQTILERPDFNWSGTTGERAVAETEDRMVLEKIDGTWYVVHATLGEPYPHFRY